jgi:hypothetical protein
MGTDGSVAAFSDVKEHAEALATAHGEGYLSDPPDGLLLSNNQRCFGWCARHPEMQCDDDAYCKEGELSSCAVVAVDACNRRVGYVCDEWDEPDGRKRTEAGEFELPEPP